MSETRLTIRQKEVLDLVAAGKFNKQIALALGISEGKGEGARQCRLSCPWGP